MNKSQNQLVLEHLLAGKTITPAKALTVYGIWRLGARIWELKQAGNDILTTLREDENGKTYAEYRLRVRDRFGRPKKVA